ncbi:MAG: prepilin peptidase [Thaumarchaeota archaeon]|nr:prepilin peptidase [Nitrososphaerota archaeon]
MIFGTISYSVYSINFVLASVMLLFTSYLDLKDREVPDKVWLIFGGIGGVLQAYEVLNGETNLVQLVIAVILGTVVGMGLFFFGFYGGADGKALIVLGLLVPHFNPMIGLYSIAPLMILTNGVLISILLPVGLLIYNTILLVRKRPIFEGFEEPLYRKILACLLGYKQTGKQREFQFSMEKTIHREDGTGEDAKKFDFSLIQDDFETKSGTWVTPGIPLLVFFTAGYFALLFYGDLVIGLIQFFSRLFGF